MRDYSGGKPQCGKGNEMIKQPMKFTNESWTWDDVHNWPLLVSPKYDGIFVMKTGGKVMTRERKPVPNVALREYLTKHLPEGVNGEFHDVCNVIGFHAIQSFFTTHDAKLDDINWCVRGFDIYNSKHFMSKYHERYRDMSNEMFATGSQRMCVVPADVCFKPEEVQALYEKYVALRCEGAVLRYANARYKQGRATLKECTALKMVYYDTCHGTIFGFTNNTGILKRNQVGAIIIDTKRFGRVEVGSGFDVATSKEFKSNPSWWVGREVVFKFKPHGMKDKPRHPILVEIL